MSDPQPQPDTCDKPGLDVIQPEESEGSEEEGGSHAQARETAAELESSANSNPDVVVKPGMSVEMP